MNDDLMRRAQAAMAKRATDELGYEQRIMLADKPVEEAITPADVAENVLPWGGLKAKAAQAALGTLFDATYGYNTKDYNNGNDVSGGEAAARAMTDMAFGVKKTPMRFAKTFAPGAQSILSNVIQGK